MKIAITSQNRKTVSGHAGKCTRFYIFDVNENKEIEKKELFELDSEMMLHNHFHGPNPNAHHPLFDLDVFITGDMGPGFPIKMKSKGIQAIRTNLKEIDEVIEQALAGTLEMLPPGDHHHHH